MPFSRSRKRAGVRSASTDANGLADATYRLSSAPGTYSVQADFAREGDLLGSTTSAPFDITKDDSSMTLSVTGKGSKRTLSARLFDSDSPA